MMNDRVSQLNPFIYRLIGEPMKSRSLHRLLKQNLFVISILPIVILGIYIFNSQSHLYQSSLESRIQDRFELYMSRMDMVDQESRGVLSHLQKTYASPDINVRLESYSHMFSEGSFIMTAFMDGTFVGSDGRSFPADYDPRQRIWFDAAMKSDDGIVITDPYKNALGSGELCMTYAIRLSNPLTNANAGVASVDIDLTELLPDIRIEDLPDGTYFALTDQNGRVLVDTKNPLAKSQQAVFDHVSKGAGNDVSRTYLKVDGKAHDVYVRKYEKTGWILMALVPRVELAKRQLEIIAVTSFVMIILILLVLHSTKRILGQVVKPIDRLVEHIGQLDLDDEATSLSADDRYPDEVRILYISMNQMLARISEQRDVLFENEKEISQQYMEIEALYEETTAMNDNLNDMVVHLNTSFTETIRALSNAIEASDHYTRGHCDRVTELAVALAENIGLDGSRVRQLELASHLHDIGKVGVPTHVLNKTERLDDEEFQLIKYHPEIGCNIIADVSFLREASPIIRQHHERVDGKGYPDGLKGNAISVEARILSIADSYDAMTSSRSYRKTPLTHEVAVEELRKHSGTQFDGSLVKAFIVMMEVQDALRSCQATS